MNQTSFDKDPQHRGCRLVVAAQPVNGKAVCTAYQLMDRAERLPGHRVATTPRETLALPDLNWRF